MNTDEHGWIFICSPRETLRMLSILARAKPHVALDLCSSAFIRYLISGGMS
jgi:hypothetical protein